MTTDKLNDIKNKLINELSDVEVHGHTEVLDKDVFNKRYSALTRMLNTVQDAINEDPIQGVELIGLRNRIRHSIRIMDLVKDCDLVK